MAEPSLTASAYICVQQISYTDTDMYGFTNPDPCALARYLNEHTLCCHAGMQLPDQPRRIYLEILVDCSSNRLQSVGVKMEVYTNAYQLDLQVLGADNSNVNKKYHASDPNPREGSTAALVLKVYSRQHSP